MKRLFFLPLALFTVLLCAPSSMDACGYGPPSPLVIFAQSDVILTGEVIRIEDRIQSIQLTPNAGKAHDMHVAIVRIDEAIKGANGLTHIRVAHFPHEKPGMGQNQCFCLAKHHDRPLYFLSSRTRGLRKNPKGSNSLLKSFKALAKLRIDPIQSLSSKDKNLRKQATALLILEAKLRDWRSGQAKKKIMDRKLSRLILTNLASFDWSRVSLSFRTEPLELFQLINPTSKEGWNPGSSKTHHDFISAAKSWCAAHAESFEISAIVRPQ